MFSENTAKWFAESIGTPTKIQEEGWPAIASGGHVLISAPTGTGKTLSAFLVFIDRMKTLAVKGELPDNLQLIYISPLKSLAGDIRENLRRPLEGISGPGLNISVRTGDTTAAERRRMIKHPPHILITTPESLYLLITSLSGRDMLKSAQAVIIDELHAVIGGKRGAHLMLSLARLDMLCNRKLQRIGLSATIEPLNLAASYLAYGEPVNVVAPKMEKSIRIDIVSPAADMRLLPEGTVWPEIARAVYENCENARTVIAFVESRMQAEKLSYYVNKLGGGDFSKTHHGCVSKEQRHQAEEQLRSGKLRLLVATSSMELGIDVGEIDLVIQIGYPRAISSVMQRLGRAGHNPGRTSVMLMFPRTSAESVYCGLTAKRALDGGIEKAEPPRKCLDVLAQHVVSMASCDSLSVDEIYSLLSETYTFAEVTRDELNGVFRMLAGDFEHEQDKPARPRIIYDRIHGTVSGDSYSRMLALSAGGTIPDRGWFTVKLPDGTRLGELEEEFVFEARVGDKFLLGSFAWKISELKRDEVIVSPSTPEGAQPPFWKGDWRGRSYRTGLAFGGMMRELSDAHFARRLHPALRDLGLDDAAAFGAANYLSEQISRTGCLPDDRTIIVEHFSDKAGDNQVMVHSVFGRRVNAGLSLLLREAARRLSGMEEMGAFDDDDGFLLIPFGGRDLPDGLLRSIDPNTATAVLTALLPETPLFNMAFRYNANRALMMGVRQGKRLPLWVQRLRSAEVLGRVAGRENHPLLQETTRECLDDYWDLDAVGEVLRGVCAGAIRVLEVRLNAPSPMSLPLRRQAEAVLLYEYSPTPSNIYGQVRQQLEQAERIKPGREQLELVSNQTKTPDNPERLHALLMAEGDIISGEVEAPLEWLEKLAYAGRALYIEPGLWICSEQSELYETALEKGDVESRLRISRRCLRFRGAQDPGSLSERYAWDADVSAGILKKLTESGAAVCDGELYYHADLYERARRETVAKRRETVTLPPERYAAFMTRRLRVSGAPSEQLRIALDTLSGEKYPPALWESVLLPARVSGYKPGLLDALLSGGDFYWQFGEGENLGIYDNDGIDWDAEPAAFTSGLSDEEEKIAKLLQTRGACFPQTLAAVLGGELPIDSLMSMAVRGLVRADSFLPVRQWMSGGKKTERSVKQRARSKAAAATSGRWELTRSRKPLYAEDALNRAFARSGILCRETVSGIPWTQALELLRTWEYTGKARRGYFIQGLSGAQFIRAEEYESVMFALQNPDSDAICINASDPAQVWGRVLRHIPGYEFTAVTGTVVALSEGRPIAVMERQGAALRVFDEMQVTDALMAFARDFRNKRIFPGKNRLTVAEYPEYAVQALENAGFIRQMLDYVLWRS